jgi:CheY-specific phosphatase CheX
MPEETIGQVLSRAAAEVLERMFFTGFVAESEAFSCDGPRIAVTVDFDGERRGTLALAISAASAHGLAADFLGLEEEPDEAQVNGVVRELANMICGGALSAVESGALRLAPPRIVPDSEVGWRAGRHCRSFDLGNGSLTVALVFQGGDNG